MGNNSSAIPSVSRFTLKLKPDTRRSQRETRQLGYDASSNPELVRRPITRGKAFGF